MPLRNVDDLLPLLTTGLPGCPPLARKQALMQAYADLCRRAHVLTETVNLTVVASQLSYTL